MNVRTLFSAVALASALAAPAVSFAQQSNGPVTRAQVRAELVELERAGFTPRGENVNYPEDIQAAEARVVAKKSGASSYGGVVSSSASGAPAAVRAGANDGMKPIDSGS
ncbi:DUF4148 domain-containing protein [Paraburkholderia sp. RL17-337-BIB-A]|uniref:DUF4148 domain-containing protein n=1 Tax=Paraburkholderia sp. RL17-337-BIB-A TaxID=3031636 RepID=UPI0038BB092F